SPDVFPDGVLLAMVDCMRRHAEYLDAHPTGGNWLCMEANGQYHVGVLFPEFANAARWRDNALMRLRREIDAQVYPDGAQIELTPGYHNVSLSNFVGALRLARLNDQPLPEGYQAGLERMYDLNMRAMSPDRDVPPFNDSWRVDVPQTLADGLELFPARKDWEWIATDGQAGAKPSVTSLAFPYAGWAVMRSGWDRDARFLMMDCGPFGYGHQHEDKLSFVLHAHGARLVFDAGSYAYDASDMRRYVLSARGHNVIHVDGMEQNRRGGPRDGYVVKEPVAMVWHTAAGYDYAAGTYGTLPEEAWGRDRKRGIVHTRRVLFVKPDWWIVCDTVDPGDSAERLVESTFHLDAPEAVVDQSSLGITTKRDGPNLAILPLMVPGLRAQIVAGQTEPALQGWLPKAHGRTGADPRPCVYYSVKASGTVHLLYVFAPYAQGKICPVASVRPLNVPDAALAAQITITRGRVFLFSLMPDGTCTLTQPDGKDVRFGAQTEDSRT
ncbi:MAG: heparinase, partial [Chthonomonadales bacterium]|nr:heparinase [Chthonomonadales bacterium]